MIPLHKVAGAISGRLVDPLHHHVYRAAAHAASAAAGGRLHWESSARAAVPIRVNGAGLVRIEENVTLGVRIAARLGSGAILLQARALDAEIRIGAGTATNNNISVVSMRQITVGQNCRIGDMVAIYDCDFHELDPRTRNRSPGETRPVSIGDNVWLGSRVLVLKGVTIGSDTVVGAGSVVTRSLPAGVVAAGNPAKPLKVLAPFG